METNCITAAPQAADAGTMYNHWMKDHNGTESDFFAFMTTPSGERTLFLSDIPCSRFVTSRLLMPTYKY